MAHKLGATHHVPHGVANGILIDHVIRYNATDVPTKQTAFSQYKYPQAKAKYARIADYLGLGGNTEDEKVENLIQAIRELREKINLPHTIEEAGIKKDDFERTVDRMSIEAFDDQCTGANPRYPLVGEIKDMYMKAFK